MLELTETMRDPTEKLLHRFVAHLPLETTDQTLVVLKGHLLVEEMLREFVDRRVRHPDELPDARLTFQQCLCLARALDEDPSRAKLWRTVEKLNTLRNKLAHSLEPKELDRHIKDFVEMQSNFDPTEPFIDDEKKFGSLASCILGMCLTLSHAVRPRDQSSERS
jgi:hypothetical protein